MTENQLPDAERQKIEAAIQAQEALRGILSDAEVDAAISALRAKLTGSGAIAQGAGAVALGERAVYGQTITNSTIITGDVYHGEKPQDAEEALNVYRRVLVQSVTNLPLRGIDVGSVDPASGQNQLSLTHVYISLDIIQPFKWYHPPTTADDKEAERKNPRETTTVLDATIAKQKLVLLGDPGGGKSTFVNYLAHCLAAHQLEPEAGWHAQLENWPADKLDLLPIIVTLRDFARSLPEELPVQAAPEHIWQHIHRRLTAQNLDFAAKPMCDLLEKGKAFVLFDGLDEVPTQAQRAFVRDAVQAFVDRYPDNRYLVTCRVLSYQPPQETTDPDLRLRDWPKFEIAPFDEEKIDRFIDAWHSELARSGNVSSADALGLAQRLKEAVRRPDLWRLASNPLLLTVMALVHTHKGRLPDARALLYEETIDILLWRWEQIKIGGDEESPRLRQLLLQAGRTDVDLKRVLWQLAFEAHSQIQAEEEGDALADISEHRLIKSLAALKENDWNWAAKIVEVMKLRAGLLLERAPEVFTFPHRTFQEYLAGAHLATQANFARQAAELAENDRLWRVVILLAVGKLVYLTGDVDKPLALVGELCPAEPDQEDEAYWRNAWLAGDVLAEIGLQRVKDSNLGRDLLKRVQHRLVDLLAHSALAARERAEAGNSLAALGDPRFNPDVWFLPDDEMLGFVEIPAGKFVMGSDPKQDKESYDEEQPQHVLELPTFYIARYPVTVAQFKAFIDDSNYKFRGPDCLKGNPNHPVVYVTWHEALAYCNWLTDALKQDDATPEILKNLLAQDWQVTLPSEAEWEKAARGTDGRIYPWGNEFDPEKANTFDTGIGNVSAVGCFVGGASPFGVLDQSGSVYEWTRSKWASKNYPSGGEEPGKREELEENASRVRRGGSFLDYYGYARCAYRFRNDSYYRSHNLGFRVVISPPR